MKQRSNRKVQANRRKGFCGQAPSLSEETLRGARKDLEPSRYVLDERCKALHRHEGVQIDILGDSGLSPGEVRTPPITGQRLIAASIQPDDLDAYVHDSRRTLTFERDRAQRIRATGCVFSCSGAHEVLAGDRSRTSQASTYQRTYSCRVSRESCSFCQGLLAVHCAMRPPEDRRSMRALSVSAWSHNRWKRPSPSFILPQSRAGNGTTSAGPQVRSALAPRRTLHTCSVPRSEGFCGGADTTPSTPPGHKPSPAAPLRGRFSGLGLS